jgi:hypothetical protein
MRKSRDSNLREEVLLKPFDVSKFGSEDDPCFGKLYDLEEEECQYCGDHEFCGIAFTQRLKKLRQNQEKQIPMKDREIDDLEFKAEVRDFIEKKREQGFRDPKIQRFIRKKFKIKNPETWMQETPGKK